MRIIPVSFRVLTRWTGWNARQPCWYLSWTQRYSFISLSLRCFVFTFMLSVIFVSQAESYFQPSISTSQCEYQSLLQIYQCRKQILHFAAVQRCQVLPSWLSPGNWGGLRVPPGRAGIDGAEQHPRQDPCCSSLVKLASHCCDSAGFICGRNVNVWATRQLLHKKLCSASLETQSCRAVQVHRFLSLIQILLLAGAVHLLCKWKHLIWVVSMALEQILRLENFDLKFYWQCSTLTQIATQSGGGGGRMQHLGFYSFYSNASWQIHLSKLYKNIITSA